MTDWLGSEGVVRVGGWQTSYIARRQARLTTVRTALRCSPCSGACHAPRTAPPKAARIWVVVGSSVPVIGSSFSARSRRVGGMAELYIRALVDSYLSAFHASVRCPREERSARLAARSEAWSTLVRACGTHGTVQERIDRAFDVIASVAGDEWWIDEKRGK